MLKLNGPDMEHFDPEPAVRKRWKAGPQSRPVTHYRCQSESENSESDEDSDL